MSWTRGELVVRREVVHGRPWHGVAAYVVEHSDELVAIYVPSGSPFGFPAGTWPTIDGRHPWEAMFDRWQGPGCLQLQRPGDAYAVWRLAGDDGSLAQWYVNLQDPFRIVGDHLGTLDHELDVVVSPDGLHCHVKDAELVDASVGLGRFDAAQAARIHRQAEEILAAVQRGDRWWERWRDWRPDETWTAPDALPDGWEA
jgi:hypothetical protein